MKKTAREKQVEEIFTGTQVGLMIEHFEDRVKIIGEGFDTKIEGLEKKMTERFDNLEGKFDNLEGRFDKFEAKTEENFEIVKKYLSRVIDDLDRITAEIKEMKSEPEKIDFDRVAELEKEVEHLKKEINRQGKLIQLKLCA